MRAMIFLMLLASKTAAGLTCWPKDWSVSLTPSQFTFKSFIKVCRLCSEPHLSGSDLSRPNCTPVHMRKQLVVCVHLGVLIFLPMFFLFLVVAFSLHSKDGK